MFIRVWGAQSPARGPNPAGDESPSGQQSLTGNCRCFDSFLQLAVSKLRRKRIVDETFHWSARCVCWWVASRMPAATCWTPGIWWAASLTGKTASLLDFYKALPDTFVNRKDDALLHTSMFGITYCCEQAFSQLKLNKSSARNQLTVDHLEAVLCLSTSIKLDISKLIAEMQHHPSVTLTLVTSSVCEFFSRA